MLHLNILRTRYRMKPKVYLKVGLCLAVILTLYFYFGQTKDAGMSAEEYKLYKDRLARKYSSAPGTNRSSSQLVKQETVLLKDIMGNFEPEPEDNGHGPGEHGAAVMTDKNSAAVKQSVQTYGINMVASEMISMTRTIPDSRPSQCKHWQYPTDLPTASVIIVFHNEGVSVILRTVWSVLHRSPPQYLHEILLVDDFSSRKNLKSEFEEKIKSIPKVRLIRNEKREGLIRTRSLGAENSRGDVVIFLDAHCEVNKNWLVPLLARIYADRHIMAVPLIDGINLETFEYRPVYQGSSQLAGTFEWGLLYKETAISKQERERRKHDSQPWRSPTHAGGLFAIDRMYFLELGGYDPGLDIWGGENYELSFKIWMCGGSIEWVPCSRVGHVYRNFMPYNLGEEASRKGNVINRNYKRVVEVWMDEYKKYFYIRKPEVKALDAGDISGQLEFRKNHNCKSFKWYMENVAYQVLTEYPLLPDNLGWGELRNVPTSLCWDVASGQPGNEVILHGCHGYGGNQQIRLNMEGRLESGERCLDVSRSTTVVMTYCKLGTVNGPWKFHEDRMLHKASGKCAAVGTDNKLVLTACANTANQKWTWKHKQDEF